MFTDTYLKGQSDGSYKNLISSPLPPANFSLIFDSNKLSFLEPKMCLGPQYMCWRKEFNDWCASVLGGRWVVFEGLLFEVLSVMIIVWYLLCNLLSALACGSGVASFCFQVCLPLHLIFSYNCLLLLGESGNVLALAILLSYNGCKCSQHSRSSKLFTYAL